MQEIQCRSWHQALYRKVKHEKMNFQQTTPTSTTALIWTQGQRSHCQGGLPGGGDHAGIHVSSTRSSPRESSGLKLPLALPLAALT